MLSESSSYLDDIITHLRNGGKYITASNISSLLPHDTSLKITSLSLLRIEKLFQFVELLTQTEFSLIRCAYVYGSTATGTAQKKFDLIEKQLMINSIFVGSLFTIEPSNGDIDIDIVTEFPQNSYDQFHKKLTFFIDNLQESYLWSFRFSHPEIMYNNIMDNSRSCIYRRVFNCSKTITITGDLEINKIKGLCQKYYSPLDREYFFEKNLLEKRVREQIPQTNLVYVPSTVYNSLAPLFFREWRPYGDKVQSGEVLKLRLPDRPHSTTIIQLENSTQMEKLIREATIING